VTGLWFTHAGLLQDSRSDTSPSFEVTLWAEGCSSGLILSSSIKSQHCPVWVGLYNITKVVRSSRTWSVLQVQEAENHMQYTVCEPINLEFPNSQLRTYIQPGYGPPRTVSNTSLIVVAWTKTSAGERVGKRASKLWRMVKNAQQQVETRRPS
jgi:hypothetical protein